MHEAFFLGCPMLCIPVFGDQHQNAATVQKLGAGVQIPSPFCPNPSPHLDHVTSEILCEQLHQVLVVNKDAIRSSCQKIRTEMQKRHAYYHSKAMIEMEAFIDKEN